MTLKILFGLFSVGIGLVSFWPYVRDVLARRTTPHLYTWLVWTVMQATATVAILRENAYWSAAGVATAGLISLCVFLLSFKYGTKNITTFDTACLVGAFLAIGVWVFAQNVTLSIVLVTLIDFLGFLPTLRKGFAEPRSETLFLYVCSAFANIFALLSLTAYSVASSLYIVSLVLSNTLFVGIVWARRATLAHEPI